jgi:hypothetical protein
MATNFSTILQLDPESHVTCIGLAKSAGRQCKNLVAKKRREEAHKALQNLGRDGDEHMEQKLKDIAELLLCKKNHQSQSGEVVSRWMNIIQGQRGPLGRLTPPPSPIPRGIMTQAAVAPISSRNGSNAVSSSHRSAVSPRTPIRAGDSSQAPPDDVCLICCESVDGTFMKCGDCNGAIRMSCFGEFERFPFNTCPKW